MGETGQRGSVLHDFVRVGRARRLSRTYTRMVNSAKLALPLIALVLLVVVFMWPGVGGDEGPDDVGKPWVGREELSDQVMVNARARGVVRGGLPYNVHSERVRRLGAEGRRFRMEAPEASVVLGDGNRLVGRGGEGVVDWEDETLRLERGVGIWHQQGYELRTDTAVMDLRAGTISGDGPVEAVGAEGWIRGEGFRVLDAGRRIHFLGRSTLVLGPAGAGS